MPKAYRIQDWHKHFENNRTRLLKVMSWLPVTTKHDGFSYIRLVDHPNGAAHLGAWLTLIQTAAKCDPRGTLLRSDGLPHDSTSLHYITRLPIAVFDEAIPRLIAIGWLETCDVAESAAIWHEGAGIPHEGAGEVPYTTQQDKTTTTPPEKADEGVVVEFLKLGVQGMDETWFNREVWSTFPDPARITNVIKAFGVRMRESDPKKRVRNPAGCFIDMLRKGCTPPAPPQTKGYAAATSKRTPALSPAPGAAFPTPDPSDPKAAEKIAAGEAFIAGKRRRVSASTAATTEVKP